MIDGKESAPDADKNHITFDSESAVFEEMKTIFETVKNGIPDNSPHLAFRNRFSEVYDFFVMIYNKNQKLLQKAQEGNAEIIINANKISTIVKIAKSDVKTLGKYKKDYDEAFNLIQALHTAEEKSKELIQNLRSTITKLNGQVQRGEAFSFGEEDNIATVIQDVKNLKREINESSEEFIKSQAQIKKEKEFLKGMNNQIEILTNNSIEIQNQIDEYETQSKKINDEIEKTRDQINEVRPIVDNQKSKIQSNIILLQNHQEEHKNLSKKNNDIGKQLIDKASKLKQFRYQVTQHIKMRNKIIRTNSGLEDHLDHLNIQFDLSIKEHEKLKKDLETEQASIQSNTETLKLLSNEFDSIEEKKREIRQTSKDVREELTKISHNEFIQDADRNRVIRQIESTTHGISSVSKMLDNEKVVTTNVSALNVDLSAEKRMQKKRMQEHKVKIRLYEQEIEEKVYDKMQIERKIQIAEDEKETNMTKVYEDNDALDELQAKLHQQEELIDVLRKERNMFKRKFLACEKEKILLNKQIGDIEEELEEIKAKNRDLLFVIADEHFTAKTIKQQLMSENIDVSELKKKVSEANHSITLLQSQRQLMRHVLNDATSDKSSMLKELGAAKGTKDTIVSTLGERAQTIDQLKSNITTLQLTVERGQKEYDKLCDSLAVLVSELKVALEKNECLEKKTERIKFAESDERRLFIGFNRETHKFAALFREISIPRNVHRWQMYSATDPQYQKNLIYLSKIYTKLDHAHRYLIDLEKERDELKKAVEENRKKVIPNGENERSSFQYHMNKYKRDIDEKDRLINEMLSEIRENRISLKNMVNGVDTIRTKCSERRISVSQLRSRNLASRTEKRKNDLFFMTEPDAPLPLGGGFVQKTPSNQNNSNTNNNKSGISAKKIVLNDNQVFADGTPRKRPCNTAKTPKGQQQRILRPQTATRRRPMTALQKI